MTLLAMAGYSSRISSKSEGENLKSEVSSKAFTEAVLGLESIRAISPRTSPSLRVFTTFLPRIIS
jgi:hypothetical protein